MIIDCKLRAFSFPTIRKPDLKRSFRMASTSFPKFSEHLRRSQVRNFIFFLGWICWVNITFLVFSAGNGHHGDFPWRVTRGSNGRFLVREGVDSRVSELVGSAFRGLRQRAGHLQTHESPASEEGAVHMNCSPNMKALSRRKLDDDIYERSKVREMSETADLLRP